MTNGVYGKEPLAPTFTKSTADQIYTDKYAKELNIDISKLDWFTNIKEPQIPYDLSPYTAEDVTRTLKS